MDDDYGLREAADKGDPKSMFAYAIKKNENASRHDGRLKTYGARIDTLVAVH